ncbi:resolvase-like protein [Paenibacillus cellulosilyticus]|uniref:Resolvase-like protein n=1 Tax=Paenibacillus cellulosilyticus TaxID=375489 RepID=A0A2V2YNB8_9BACL|nr:recombinase family protein [Paenibacillus cellulosilyticus]PWV90583.1 resolvase-like protein [Paenibacillus cellulosilyticus]QKS46784.1 recombinase family protein [Paenibacillus cellulosilyticus]
MEFIGYVRTGSIEQSDLHQLTLLNKFAIEREYEFSGIYIDNGFSTSQHRPEFDRVIQKLSSGKVTLVVVSPDRIYRSVTELAEFFSFVKASESHVISLDGGIDSNNPMLSVMYEGINLLDRALQRSPM